MFAQLPGLLLSNMEIYGATTWGVSGRSLANSAAEIRKRPNTLLMS